MSLDGWYCPKDNKSQYKNQMGEDPEPSGEEQSDNNPATTAAPESVADCNIDHETKLFFARDARSEIAHLAWQVNVRHITITRIR
jgi:hypothetical protein